MKYIKKIFYETFLNVVFLIVDAVINFSFNRSKRRFIVLIRKTAAGVAVSLGDYII